MCKEKKLKEYVVKYVTGEENIIRAHTFEERDPFFGAHEYLFFAWDDMGEKNLVFKIDGGMVSSVLDTAYYVS